MKKHTPNSQYHKFSHLWTLFYTLTWTTFKLRYYGNFLGYVWSLLQPLSLFAIMYVVFTIVWKIDTPHYSMFLLLGIIIWQFFVSGTTDGMKAFIGNYQMIRKVYLPRIVLVAASATSSLIGFLLNLLVFFVFALFEGVPFTWKVIYFLPLLVAVYFLILGISLILSIVVVRLRDMQNLWEVVTTLGFWVTPVMYPMIKVPEEWRFYMFLNPISGILEYSRYFLVGIGSVTHLGYFYVIGFSIAILAFGIYYFEKKNPEMTEEL